MLKQIKSLSLLSLVVLVSACTTAYQKQGFTGGYADEKIDEDSYLVSFYGNGNTGGQQVWNFWIYRCAEITLEKGFDTFELESTSDYAHLPYLHDGQPVEFTMLPFAPDQQGESLTQVQYYITTVTSYSSTAIVHMYKQPVPDTAGIVLDAQTVIDTLTPYVKNRSKVAPPVRKDLYIRAAVEAAIRANRVEPENADKLSEQLRTMI